MKMLQIKFLDIQNKSKMLRYCNRKYNFVLRKFEPYQMKLLNVNFFLLSFLMIHENTFAEEKVNPDLVPGISGKCGSFTLRKLEKKRVSITSMGDETPNAVIYEGSLYLLGSELLKDSVNEKANDGFDVLTDEQHDEIFLARNGKVNLSKKGVTPFALVTLDLEKSPDGVNKVYDRVPCDDLANQILTESIRAAFQPKNTSVFYNN